MNKLYLRIWDLVMLGVISLLCFGGGRSGASFANGLHGVRATQERVELKPGASWVSASGRAEILWRDSDFRLRGWGRVWTERRTNLVARNWQSCLSD